MLSFNNRVKNVVILYLIALFAIINYRPKILDKKNWTIFTSANVVLAILVFFIWIYMFGLN